MPLPGSVLPSGLAVHGCWAALRGSHLGWRPQDSSGVPEGKDKPPRPHPPNIPRSFQGVQPVGVLKRVGKDMPPPGSKVDRLDLLRPAAADFQQVRVTPAPLQWRSLVRSMRLLTLAFVHRLTVAVLPFPSPGNLSGQGTEPKFRGSPALAGGFFTTKSPRKPIQEDPCAPFRNLCTFSPRELPVRHR